jgi:hypothetical protein
MWIITGSRDTMLGQCRVAKRLFSAAGFVVKFTEIPDAQHEYILDRENDIWNFLTNPLAEEQPDQKI